MRRLMSISIAIMIAIAGCSCDGTSAPVDGGRDAGTDAGRDAGRDASRDAGVDASADAPITWERIPGFPDDCYFERATRPQDALADVAWVPCDAPWPSGCQWLVADGPLRSTYFNAVSSYGRELNRGQFSGHFRDADDAVVAVDMDADLRAYAAWRTQREPDSQVVCERHASSGGGSLAVGLDIKDYADGGTSGGRVWHRRLDALSDLGDPEYSFGPEVLPWGNSIDQASSSATTVALRISPRAHIWVLDEGRSGMLVGSDVGIAVDPVVVGHDVLYLAVEGYAVRESRIMHGGIDRPAETLHYRAGETIFSFDASAQHVVWERVTERAPALVIATEVWAADFTTDPAAFAPRLVRPAGPSAAVRVGVGVIGRARVGMPTAEGRLPYYADLIEIDSGAQLTYAFPIGYRATGLPIWTTPDEIAIPTERWDAEREEVVGSIVRIPRSAMAPVP